MNFYLKQRLVKNTHFLAIISILLFGLSASKLSFAQTVIFEESFSSGLGSFSGSGRVYTGSYGARMRGGSSGGTITSIAINTSDYSNLQLSFDRSMSGLDSGEAGTASYSTNGSSYTVLESARSASGRTSFSLPNASTIYLRFAVDASSFFERYEVDNIVLEGEGGGGGCQGPDCCPPNCGGGGGTLPPVDRVDANGPFQTTEQRNTGPGRDGWVVHPTNLGADGLDHPIFIWGPGAGTGPQDYDWFLDRLASHGFVVYSEVSTSSGNEMNAALAWLIDQNNNPSSIYFQKLDTTKVAAGGHSRGSISTFESSIHSQLTTTVHVAGGSFDGQGPDNLRNPTIYIGGTDDFATPNMERDYDNTDVPVFFTIMDGVDHIAATREGQVAIVAWLRWQLGGEDFRRGDFLDTFCEYCQGVYDSESKNW